jgi:hypothetical protein
MIVGVVIAATSGIAITSEQARFETGVVIITGGIFTLVSGFFTSRVKDEEILDELYSLRQEVQELRGLLDE